MTTQTQTTIQKLVDNAHVTTLGFPAIQQLGQMSNQNALTKVILSALPAPVMFQKGINEYYALVMPRDAKFNTGQEIYDADLQVNKFRVEQTNTKGLETIIVSRHAATNEILTVMFPNVPVLTGNVKPEDITGKHVVGQIPPHMVTLTEAYTTATIKDYNYAIEGDLTADQIKDRLSIVGPIKLTQIG